MLLTGTGCSTDTVTTGCSTNQYDNISGFRFLRTTFSFGAAPTTALYLHTFCDIAVIEDFLYIGSCQTNLVPVGGISCGSPFDMRLCGSLFGSASLISFVISPAPVIRIA